MTRARSHLLKNQTHQRSPLLSCWRLGLKAQHRTLFGTRFQHHPYKTLWRGKSSCFHLNNGIPPTSDAGILLFSLQTEVEGRNSPTPVRALARHRVVAVAMGRHHSAVIVEAGHLYTFGRNMEGQLGTGNVKAFHAPMELKSLASVSINVRTVLFLFFFRLCLLLYQQCLLPHCLIQLPTPPPPPQSTNDECHFYLGFLFMCNTVV